MDGIIEKTTSLVEKIQRSRSFRYTKMTHQLENAQM